MKAVFSHKGPATSKVLYVAFAQEGIAAVICDPSNQDTKIQSVDFLKCTAAERQQALLKYVAKHDLEHAACHVVLEPHDYRLLLLDSPNVSVDEMKQAARWLVKDLIDFPIERAAIDVFEAPVKRKLYIAVVHSELLIEIEQILTAAMLQLRSINIADLALRNFMATLPNSENGVGFVFRDAGCLHILITRHATVYLERRIDVDSAEINEDVVLELQRSLDFYQTRLGKIVPIALFLGPSFHDEEQAAKRLSEDLTIPVSIFKLEEYLKLPAAVDYKLQSKCLSVLCNTIEVNIDPTKDRRQLVDFKGALPEKEKTRLPAGHIFAGCLILILVLTSLFIYKKSGIDEFKQQVLALQKQEQQLTTQLVKTTAKYAETTELTTTEQQKVQRLMTEEKVKKKMVAMLKQMSDERRNKLSGYLELFGQNVVPNVWLTGFSIKHGGAVVRLTGYAYRSKELLGLVDKLNSAEVFANNHLRLFELRQVKNKSELSFVLNTPEVWV